MKRVLLVSVVMLFSVSAFAQQFPITASGIWSEAKWGDEATTIFPQLQEADFNWGLANVDAMDTTSIEDDLLGNTAIPQGIHIILEDAFGDISATGNYGWAERYYLEGTHTYFTKVNGTLYPADSIRSGQPKNDPYYNREPLEATVFDDWTVEGTTYNPVDPYTAGASYTAIFRLAIGKSAAVPSTMKFAEIEVYDSSKGIILNSNTVDCGSFHGNHIYAEFPLSFTVPSGTWADKIDLRVWWYQATTGTDTLFLDYIRVDGNDGKWGANPDSLFSGLYNGEIEAKAKALNKYLTVNNASVSRYYLKDEPYITQYLSYAYIDSVLKSVSADPASGQGLGITQKDEGLHSHHHNWTGDPWIRFIQEAHPYELAAEVDKFYVGDPQPGDADYTATAQSELQNEMVKFDSAEKDCHLTTSGTWRAYINSSSWDPKSGNGTYREPHVDEIAAQVWCALAHGAKGIDYFNYISDPSEGDTGLVDPNFSPINDGNSYEKYPPENKWNSVYSINHTIEDYIGPILMSSTWDAAYSIDGTVNGSCQYISSVSTSATSGSIDPPGSTFVELGFFTGQSGNRYFMVVNRRTDPTDARNIKISFSLGSGTWIVSDVNSGNSWVVASNGSFTDSFNAGEGKMFEVTSAVIPSGTTMTLNPGDTVRLASGTSLVVDGTLNASGTMSKPIYFKEAVSGDHWNDIQLSGGNSSLSKCVFDGGTVYLDQSQGNTFTHCTFDSSSGDGLELAGAGVSIDSCTFSHNQTGLYLGSSSTASINHSTMSHNAGVGLYMGGGTISDFTHNAVESNGSYGIDNESGTMYMGNGSGQYSIGVDAYSTSPTYGEGENSIKNNCTSSGSAQIYLDTNGRLYVGNLVYSSPDYFLTDGYNTVTSPSTLYIYNLAMTQGYESEVQWAVPAMKTYWGGNATSGNFYGTVEFNYQLTLDLSGGAGAGTPLEVTAPVVNKTPATLMTAAMAANVYKSAPNAAAGQYFVNLKNKMMQVMNNINNPETGMTRPRMVGYLSSLCSFDTNNVTGERSEVQQLISNYYGQLPSGNFSDETARLCSEAALVTEVRDQVTAGKLDNAEALMNDYGRYIQNNDNKRTLLFAQMEIDQRRKQDVEALGVLKQIEAFKPDSKQEKGYEAPDYAVMASFLGQSASNESPNKEVPGGQTQKVPTKFALLQNYPNPFNPTTTIDYDLATPANVRLIVYDVTGQEVAVLESGNQSAGSYSTTFNGSRFASGVYFVRLIAEGQNGRQYIKTMKMLMLK